ncbi:MAG: hypothetical protein WCH78_04760 [Bacteroidota bacterium]
MQIVKSIVILSFCIIWIMQVNAQKEPLLIISDVSKRPSEITISTHSRYAPFPDSARINGHDYNGQHFAYMGHYDDSTVKIFVPKNINIKKPLELVIWFHGWNNNVDSAISFYGLTEQFRSANRNAIIVFPEGPKNAPDSYGGKLERPEMFALFINDILKKLEAAKVIPKKKQLTIKDCSISLAGHSGAYRVISKIIQYNKIDELLLFDAMYGGNEAYLHWIAENEAHRFIQIYTKDGGTFDNTHLIMNQLKDSLKVDILSVTEKELQMDHLQSSKPLFIFSENEHNEVITLNNNFYRFLHRWKKGDQWQGYTELPRGLKNWSN